MDRRKNPTLEADEKQTAREWTATIDEKSGNDRSINSVRPLSERA